jgi:hypothetical protein
MPRHNNTHVGNAAATAHSRVVTRRSMAMCAADGLRRQWFRREPIFVAKAAEDLVARAGEHCRESMLHPPVDTRMCAVRLLGVSVSVPYLPVRVRACVCVRAQSFSRANEMVERLKDQTNYVLDKCA